MSFLTPDPLSLDPLFAAVAGPTRGGTCVFLGTVRDGPDDAGVIAIEYSAYDAMAETELARIVEEAETRWPDARVAVRHRMGRVPLGEASVAIVAAAPHRAEAFAACRYAIEQIKVRLPVWKKEQRSDGTATWVDPAGWPAAAGPR